MRCNLLFTLVIPAGFALPVFAHDGDIGIRINADNRIETVLAGGEPPNQTFGADIERIFVAELVFNATANDVRIDEPGLASEAAGLLNQPLGLNIRKALRRWNGSGFETTPLTLSVGGSDLGLPFSTTPLTDTLVTGPSIVVPEIPLDFHMDWVLDGATTSTGDGIYLLEIELASPGGNLLTSDPLWVVYNYNLTESEHDAAIEYVAANYIPAANSMLLAIPVAYLGARRRQR